MIEHSCGGPAIVTCGACLSTWCERCDPAPSALCHHCHGRGYSTAPAGDGRDYRPEGAATAGNNRRVHVVRYATGDHFVTMCGARTPKRPQTTQDQLSKCGRCFA